jgi:hypothetical protein
MAEETYLVTIGSVVLSTDGTPLGVPCSSNVQGLTGFFLGHTGATRIALNGAPYNFVRENLGQGVRIVTKPFVVTADVLDLLKSEIDAANASASAIPVKIENGPMSALVDCDPLFEGDAPPITWTGEFFNDQLYNVEIRLITRGFTA